MRRTAWPYLQRHRTPLAVLGLVALTLVPYAQVVGFDFVRWDDDRYVYAHPVVGQGLSWEGAAWVFTHPVFANWTPLSWLSHMLDVELFGSFAGGHHATSLLLHVLNTLLLFGLLRSATGAVGRSALVAALFSIHPLHVESVAWIAERRDVLSTAFGLGSLWCYVAWARGGRRRAYAASLALLALGLLSKSMLVTLPVLLLLLDYWPLERREPLQRLVLEKLPFVALVVAASAITLLTQGAGAYMPDTLDLPLGARLGNAVVSALWYLGRTVWPTGLAAFHPHPNLPGGADPWTALQVGAAALALALSSLWVYARRRQRPIAVGWLWFLVTLLPVIGIVQVGSAGLADRYSYVPLIGIFMAVSWGAHHGLVERLGLARPAAWAAAAAVAALTIVAHGQVGTWRDSVALFEHGIAVTEGNYLFHFNLGNEYRRAGDGVRAALHYREALAIHPGMADAQQNLASLLHRSGDLDGAIEHYARAARLRPQDPRALQGLARAGRERDGSNEAVIAFLRARIDESPEPYALHAAVGNLLAEDGRLEDAALAYRVALEIEPGADRVRERLRALEERIQATPTP